MALEFKEQQKTSELLTLIPKREEPVLTISRLPQGQYSSVECFRSMSLNSQNQYSEITGSVHDANRRLEIAEKVQKVLPPEGMNEVANRFNRMLSSL
jgi:hypothetical protein